MHAKFSGHRDGMPEVSIQTSKYKSFPAKMKGRMRMDKKDDMHIIQKPAQPAFTEKIGAGPSI